MLRVPPEACRRRPRIKLASWRASTYESVGRAGSRARRPHAVDALSASHDLDLGIDGGPVVHLVSAGRERRASVWPSKVVRTMAHGRARMVCPRWLLSRGSLTASDLRCRCTHAGLETCSPCCRGSATSCCAVRLLCAAEDRRRHVSCHLHHALSSLLTTARGELSVCHSINYTIITRECGCTSVPGLRLICPPAASANGDYERLITMMMLRRMQSRQQSGKGASSGSVCDTAGDTTTIDQTGPPETGRNCGCHASASATADMPDPRVQLTSRITYLLAAIILQGRG